MYICRLWKDKCFKFGIYEPQLSPKRKTLGFSSNPWKQVLMYRSRPFIMHTHCLTSLLHKM